MLYRRVTPARSAAQPLNSRRRLGVTRRLSFKSIGENGDGIAFTFDWRVFGWAFAHAIAFRNGAGAVCAAAQC